MTSNNFHSTNALSTDSLSHEALAKLAGFSLDADLNSPLNDATTAEVTLHSEENSIGEPNTEEFGKGADQMHHTTWSSNPLVQLGAAATGVGLVFISLYALVNNVHLPQATVSDPVPDTTAASPQTTRTDGGFIKTSLAFGQEEKELAALSQPQKAADAKASQLTTQPTLERSISGESATTGASIGVSNKPQITAPFAPAPTSAPVAPPASSSIPVYAAPSSSSLVARAVQSPAVIPTPAITPVSYVPPAPATRSRPPISASPVSTPVVSAPISASPQVKTQKIELAATTAALPAVKTKEDKAIALQKAAVAPGVTIPIGTNVAAVVETPILVGQLPGLKSQLRLTEAITSFTGEVLLPKNTLLIAESITGSATGATGVSRDNGAAYLRIIGAVMQQGSGSEQAFIPFPSDAAIALARNEAGTGELFRGPQVLQRSAQGAKQGGFDLQRALVAGAIATMDLDSDSVLGGVAIDVLGQLGNKQQPRVQTPQPAAQQPSWTIPVGTELLVFTNQPVQVPALIQRPKAVIKQPLNPGNDQETVLVSADAIAAPPAAPSLSGTTSPISTSPTSTSLVGFGSVPTSTVPVVLRPDASKTLSFLTRHETILSAWVSNPEMATLAYDQPLTSGKAAVIQVQLNPATKPETKHATADLDVITTTASGKRRWHRFQLSQDDVQEGIQNNAESSVQPPADDSADS